MPIVVYEGMDLENSPLPNPLTDQRLAGTRRVLLNAALYLGVPVPQAAAAPSPMTRGPVARVPVRAVIPSIAHLVAQREGRVVGTRDVPEGVDGWPDYPHSPTAQCCA